ncbi:ABC transporter ATP-binding protein [uncultured Megasphaera sp.]|uniref:ABC transporter ATP-binding protein n=1 Tax=uncultured Megasphaera sp. TaxID=165188 RepID=UPI002623A624|nr:ABC transporter ATP-binding protein [uncultured Megasphaera sp.]
MTGIEMKDLRLQYGARVIADQLQVTLDKPEIVSIIGPNGSGKSTLLKAMARLLLPSAGTVYLHGRDMNSFSADALARIISFLPQSAQAPGDMTVRDLVLMGRLPYQGLFSSLSEDDIRAADKALEETEMTELRHHRLSELSGGERQRAWLSLALAKEPEILLLDEPTTYLDIHHQLDLMELIAHLYETTHMMVVMVLHDLNHAARYSHRLIAVKKGRIVVDGPVEEVFTKDIIEPLYQIQAAVTQVREGNHLYTVCIPYATK